MPVRPLTRVSSPSEDALKAELLKEMRNPAPSGEPDVIIDNRAGGGVHLFVVWSNWANVEQTVRSRVILDAYEEWQGEQEALRVTVSMGLTPDEAKAMGIS